MLTDSSKLGHLDAEALSVVQGKELVVSIVTAQGACYLYNLFLQSKHWIQRPLFDFFLKISAPTLNEACEGFVVDYTLTSYNLDTFLIRKVLIVKTDHTEYLNSIFIINEGFLCVCVCVIKFY